MALADLGDRRLRVELVSPRETFVLRPQMVGEPWGGAPLRVAWRSCAPSSARPSAAGRSRRWTPGRGRHHAGRGAAALRPPARRHGRGPVGAVHRRPRPRLRPPPGAARRPGDRATSRSSSRPGPRGRCRPTSWRCSSPAAARGAPCASSPPSGRRSEAFGADAARAVRRAARRPGRRRRDGQRDRAGIGRRRAGEHRRRAPAARRAAAGGPAVRRGGFVPVDLGGGLAVRRDARACTPPATSRRVDQAGRPGGPAGRRGRRGASPRRAARKLPRCPTRRSCAASSSARTAPSCTCGARWTAATPARPARSRSGGRPGVVAARRLSAWLARRRAGGEPSPSTTWPAPALRRRQAGGSISTRSWRWR